MILTIACRKARTLILFYRESPPAGGDPGFTQTALTGPAVGATRLSRGICRLVNQTGHWLTGRERLHGAVRGDKTMQTSDAGQLERFENRDTSRIQVQYNLTS